MSETTIFSSGDDHCIGGWRNVLIMIWRGPSTLEALDTSLRASDTLYKQYPGGLVSLSLLESKIALGGPEVRRRAADIWKATSGRIHNVAIVIPGEGFWNSAARAAMSGITLMVRPPFPLKVFGDLEEGAKWQYPAVESNGAPVADFLTAIENLRKTRSA